MSGSIPFCEGLTTVISTVFNKGKLGTGNGKKTYYRMSWFLKLLAYYQCSTRGDSLETWGRGGGVVNFLNCNFRTKSM